MQYRPSCNPALAAALSVGALWAFLGCGPSRLDGGFDAGIDGGFDAGFDAGSDAGFDAGIDGGSDAGIGLEDWLVRARDPTRPASERISAALEGVARDPCAGTLEVECDTAELTLGVEHLSPELDPTERILVIDDIHPSIDMLRHRHRIVGVFSVASDGTIIEQDARWELPRTYGDVVTAFASFPSLSAKTLEPLRAPLDEAYGARVPVGGSHGLVVHWILTDRIPDRGILFLDYGNLSFLRAVPDVVCAVESATDAESLATLRRHAQSTADSLRGLIDEHEVTVINASWGFTVASLEGPWARVCGAPAPPRSVLRAILDAYTPLFTALFGTDGVFVAHAALQSSDPADAPFDHEDPRFYNRLRVGSLGDVGTEIPMSGSSVAPAGSRPHPVDRSYADVFVNSGCNDTDCRPNAGLTLSGPHGFGVAPFPLTQSSFVTPILTAELVIRRQRDFASEAWSDELIDALMEVLRGQCDAPPCYRDPLLHGGLPGP